MIKRSFTIVYVLLVCIFPTVCCNAQTIQTYSGPFENLEKSVLDPNGKATYSYYQEKNKRIFHGKFQYNDKHTSITGSFINNKQDGEWIYKKNELTTSTIIKATFKDGIANGPVSIKVVDSKTSAPQGYVNANVVGNTVVGKISAMPHSSMAGIPNSVYFIPYFHRTTGAFNNLGAPIGTWVVKDQITELNESFSEDGSWNVSFFNTSTGDTINDKIERHPELPNIIIRIVNNALNKLVMRDTNPINIEEIEFKVSPAKEKTVRDRTSTRIKDMINPRKKGQTNK